MKQLLTGIVGYSLISSLLICSASSAQDPPALKTRTFDFQYRATIGDVPQGAAVRIWIPIAESNVQQDIELTKSTTPSPLEFNREEKNENQIGYCQFEADGKPVSISVNYQVNRREASTVGPVTPLTNEQRELFLTANLLIPITGRPLSLLEKQQLPDDPLAAGQTLYDLVEQHMRYDKSNPGFGRGDAVWACDSQSGNCTDFHSLFISLARSRSIPAKFEMGFPLGVEDQGNIAGYHCWAWFYAEGRGWIPVDISEADKHPELKTYYFGHLTADRIAFSNGRDIQLVPRAQAEPLNFFIFPHVEVDGKVWPKEKIQLDFSYKNRTVTCQ